jgi:chemotaxis protein methyltransferase CheR
MEVSDSAGRVLTSLLEARTGQQLGIGRRWRIETALRTPMRERGIASLDELVGILGEGRDASLAEDVVEALLNNETFFFRDRASFDLLLRGPVQRIREARIATKRLSIWCAGVSTGQEAYSLAMAFAEDPRRWEGWKIEIVGTDISRSAIARAREGLYTQFEVQRGLSVLQMMRWFEEEAGQKWRASPELRSAVRFEAASLNAPPPRGRPFDLILCRNVLLYFPLELCRSVFDRLAAACAPDGCLMLGAGETILGQTEAFVSDPDNRGLYLPRPSVQALQRRSSAA